MNITVFTYIIGIVTILGFVLQVFNVFRGFKTISNKLTFIFLGIFIGSFIGALDIDTIKLNVEITWIHIFLVLLLIIAIITLIMAYSNYENERSEFLQIIGVITGGLFLLIIVVGIAINKDNEKEKISKNELIQLSNFNLSNNNYDRAIMYLKEYITRIDTSDIRHKEISKKIDSLKIIQIKF
ncbi:MAG: hypothetical protein K8S16_01080 [Bacteroidales bacterium]|nr:hypothetical protein [Bacteroidales bacterium]